VGASVLQNAGKEMPKAKRSSSTRKKSPGKRRQKRDAKGIFSYRDKNVVVDTNSNFLYIGRLEDVNDHFVLLRDADVHDCRQSPSMNEKYIMEAKKFGVRCNRRLVHIRLQEVISMSLLDDVIEY
jgi:small nuclear ribonucleoprotein (snRNP)-like protein